MLSKSQSLATVPGTYFIYGSPPAGLRSRSRGSSPQLHLINSTKIKWIKIRRHINGLTVLILRTFYTFFLLKTHFIVALLACEFRFSVCLWLCVFWRGLCCGLLVFPAWLRCAWPVVSKSLHKCQPTVNKTKASLLHAASDCLALKHRLV